MAGLVVQHFGSKILSWRGLACKICKPSIVRLTSHSYSAPEPVIEWKGAEEETAASEQVTKMKAMLQKLRSFNSKNEKFTYTKKLCDFARANSIELWKWIDIDDFYEALTPELNKSNADEIVDLMKLFDLRDPLMKDMMGILYRQKDALTLDHWVYLCNVVDQVPLIITRPASYFTKMKNLLLHQMREGVKMDAGLVTEAIKTLRRSTGHCQHKDIRQIVSYLTQHLNSFDLDNLSLAILEVAKFRSQHKICNASFLNAVSSYFINLLDKSSGIEEREQAWGKGYGYYFSRFLQFYGITNFYHEGVCERLVELYLSSYDREIHNPCFTEQLMIMCRKIRFYDKALFDRVMQEVLDSIDAFHLNELSGVLWSLASLNHGHTKLLSRVAEVLMESNGIRHTCWLYWSIVNSCVTMNYYPPKLLKRFLTNSMMKDMKMFSPVALLKLLIGLAVENPHLGLAKRRSLKFGSYPYHFMSVSDEYVLRAISFLTTEMPTHKSFSIFGSNFCRALKVVVGKNGYVSEPCTFSGHVCDFEVCFDAKNRPVSLPGLWKYVHLNRALLSVGACEDASRTSRAIDESSVPLLVRELKSSEAIDHVSTLNSEPCGNPTNLVSQASALHQVNERPLPGLSQLSYQVPHLQQPKTQQLSSEFTRPELPLSQSNTESAGSNQETDFISNHSETNVVSCSDESSDSSQTSSKPSADKVLQAKSLSVSKSFFEMDAFQDDRTLSCILEAVEACEAPSSSETSYESIGAISCYDAKTHQHQTFSSSSRSAVPESEKPKDERPASKMYIRNSGFSVHLASDWGQYFVSTGPLLRRKVLFELNGPMHYAVNNQRHMLGKDVVKKRQLEAMGWEVMPVSYLEWQEYKTGDDHVQLITKKLYGQ